MLMMSIIIAAIPFIVIVHQLIQRVAWPNK